jgi:hypothetical protein
VLCVDDYSFDFLKTSSSWVFTNLILSRVFQKNKMPEEHFCSVYLKAFLMRSFFSKCSKATDSARFFLNRFPKLDCQWGQVQTKTYNETDNLSKKRVYFKLN